jgi:putative transposase
VRRRAGWYASIQTEREFLVPRNSFRKHEARLRRYQRTMSRKVKFSQNWFKDSRRVQNIHSRIAKVRKDCLHKATTTLSKTHAIGEEGTGLARKRKRKPASKKQEPAEETHAIAA